MNTPKFSIIIPAYNAENHIHKALQSIKSQTFKDYELIVVCDSCTDKTEEIARKYGAVTLSIQAHNDGIARSRGLDEAVGEWVLFMDDDDWWLHEYVLWQLADKLKTLRHIDVLCFSFIFKGIKYAEPRGNKGRHWVSVWNKCWRRATIGDTRFPNIPMCSDRYFHQDMMRKGLNIVDWDMPMYYYNYMREGSQTANDKPTKTVDTVPIIDPEPYIHYLIHTYPSRLWYVEQFLIPSMIEQGIAKENIKVWNDSMKLGNLEATMRSFREMPMDGQGTWHLQDDIVISNNFKQLTEKYNDGLVCGFCSRYSRGKPSGVTNVRNMWYSFPCIRIPNNLAKECSKWWYNEAQTAPKYKPWVDSKKHDDEAFKEFLRLNHPNIRNYNLDPNIVEHVDYLLGGSLVNPQRKEFATSLHWKEPKVVEQLQHKLKQRKDLAI